MPCDAHCLTAVQILQNKMVVEQGSLHLKCEQYWLMISHKLSNRNCLITFRNSRISSNGLLVVTRNLGGCAGLAGTIPETLSRLASTLAHLCGSQLSHVALYSYVHLCCAHGTYIRHMHTAHAYGMLSPTTYACLWLTFGWMFVAFTFPQEH